MADEHFDAVVIGAGQAGVPLARTLAQAGRKTALIEREHVGGSCVNEGCTPTKTMVASARVAHLARRAEHYGVHLGSVSVDMKRVRERKRDVVELFRSGVQNGLEQAAGLDLIFGEARFQGARSLELSLPEGKTRRLRGEQVFINTGQRPLIPPIAGLGAVPYLNSTTIMELDRVPEHLVVLGGGYVGLEFAQMFRRFGAEVTVVERGGQLLRREDQDVAEEMAGILREDGLSVLTDAETVEVVSRGELVELTLRGAKGERTVAGSHLLVATGRQPNSDGLELEAAGIETDERGYIRVDERLRTSAEGVYALGDVKGGPAFTHISYDDFRIVRANLLEGGDESTEGRVIPYTIFTDPQLGRVGLSERQAREQGRRIRVARLPMIKVARALEVDETRGFMKALVGGDDRILGAAVLGVDGGEVIAVLELAMLGGLPYTLLRDSPFSHPTLAEALNNLFMSFESEGE